MAQLQITNFKFTYSFSLMTVMSFWTQGTLMIELSQNKTVLS